MGNKGGSSGGSSGGSGGGGSGGGSAGADDKDVIVLDDNNFEDLVMKSKAPWFVEFYAPWVIFNF